jgi:phosphorylated CTD-interacting factor 1
LRVGKTKVRLNVEHFNKLKTLYECANASGTFVERDFLFDAFAMVCRYDAATGGQYRFAGGHHASLHGEVFDVLRDCFKVECELFASPLNCRWPTYCSKYADVDASFGSLGDYREFRPKAGAFEANPPFDEAVVARMAEHLFECLNAASSALTFVVVTPHWPNRSCWETMRRSKFCSRAEVILVREHGFCEGAQHRKTSRYRRATSDTSVLFLQNKSAVKSNPVTDKKISLLRDAFRAKRDAKK